MGKNYFSKIKIEEKIFLQNKRVINFEILEFFSKFYYFLQKSLLLLGIFDPPRKGPIFDDRSLLAKTNIAK
jgi:hypothetical protein